MAILMIRNLDENVKRELRKRAAERGVSMEQEARDRLAESLDMPRRQKSIYDDLTRLGIALDKPFDQKKATDEMWDESFR
jgi:plasmid stability protein